MLNKENKYTPVSHIPSTDRRLKDSHRQAPPYHSNVSINANHPHISNPPPLGRSWRWVKVLTTINTTYQAFLRWGGTGGG